MFTYIRRAHRPVPRDEAAASVGISRKLAAFHLDKLVAAGLLHARYETPGGMRKVGRRPKVYEPSDTQLLVTIPERRHELLADILLDALLADGDSKTALAAALRVARRRGRQLGAAERTQSRPGRLGAERGLTLCERMLEQHGFEPVREAHNQMRLTNCPFAPQSGRSPELVCGIAHSFLTGYLDGLRVSGVQAVPQLPDGQCCVRLRPTVPVPGSGPGGAV
jgi:predicted ArsR family transcriptional regulator